MVACGMCRGGTGSRVLAVSIVGIVENFSGGGLGFERRSGHSEMMSI
jgi:hypothetical protein